MRMIDADALAEAIGVKRLMIQSWKSDSAWGVPIVDAEPVRHGRWKYTPAYQGAEFGFYACSSCGSPYWWNTSKYCPDCGARMDGGEDDE